ncbi:DUF5339 domain-containing protein [Seminibacterium arietis]|uniref:DUF5339 domain-containing protein n=1 Tax=Seminibacterium arietis TaxID=1173502 RepID=A0ABW3I8N0_9PAST
MRKNIRSILTALFIFTISYSSLSLAEQQPKNEPKAVSFIPEQCKKLFEETENLIAEAEKQPGTHVQLRKIKSKLNQSKQKILEMELETQIKSCDIGLTKLSLRQQ